MDHHMRLRSAAKSICSCKGPGFDSQLPHGGSQPSITSVPENSTHYLTSGAQHACGAQIYKQAKHPHTR